MTNTQCSSCKHHTVCTYRAKMQDATKNAQLREPGNLVQVASLPFVNGIQIGCRYFEKHSLLYSIASWAAKVLHPSI